MHGVSWETELLAATEVDEAAVLVELEEKSDEVHAYAQGLEQALPIYRLLAGCLESDDISERVRDAERRIAECDDVASLLRNAHGLIEACIEERDEEVEAWAQAEDGAPDGVRAAILGKPSVRKLVVIAHRLMDLESALTESYDWLLADIVTIDSTGIYAKLESEVPTDDLSDTAAATVGFLSFLSDPSNNFALIEERMDELGDDDDEEEEDEDIE